MDGSGSLTHVLGSFEAGGAKSHRSGLNDRGTPLIGHSLPVRAQIIGKNTVVSICWFAQGHEVGASRCLDMSDSGSGKPTGRNLPSWMSSRDTDKKSESKEPSDDDKCKRQGKPHANQATTSSESSLGSSKSSKLLEGVVFVLSGFVNPERSTLRSQALEMGAKYEADWNNNCTLLVCAFPNTPKFRQVEADNGTIISKEWITECYNQKKLVGIEPYLLHAGKPWRHQSSSSSTNISSKKVDKSTDSKPQASTLSKKQTAHKNVKNEFSTSEVKKWAIDDVKRTISWLESQDEKPDPSEIKKVAAEGILTCLQDALDSLKQGQGLGKIMEEWSFVPRVIEELNKLDISGDNSKKDIYHQAIVCKKIYEFEVGNLEHDTKDNKNKRPKIEKGVKTENPKSDAAAYDSDDTIEMTEDEVTEAFDNIVNDDHFAHRS
ncbi:unnamed protein product [Lactuca saligna]|uniref:BRCT domain-containing protein n=1 Tax=Lactuca saligna TaxID=75948 RepID=A0AA35YVX1_LACSI|nr:unnamed protein product [Lactuca saligna]